MFYPDKNKKYVRIRKNHRNYQEELLKKRRTRNIAVVILLLVCVVTMVVFKVPQTVTMRAVNFYRSNQAKTKQETVEEQRIAQEKAAEEARKEEALKRARIEKEKATPVTLVFAGDVELSQAAIPRYDESGIDGVVSQALLDEIKEADLFAINHEYCISDRGTPANKQYTFRVPPDRVNILKEVGVDIAGLGNNHCLDYGPDALTDTIRILNGAKISSAGAGPSLDEAAKLIVKKKHRKKFGFLICSHIIPSTDWNVENVQPGVFTCYDPAELLSRVEEAKESCDYLFVMLHWGLEKTTALESYQDDLAHSIIDAGADAVIGSHPHVLQTIEYYNEKPIFFSLGNFIFGEETPQSAVLKVVAGEDKDAVSYQLLPTYAAQAKTYLAQESEEEGKSEAILQSLRDLSPSVEIAPDGMVSEIQAD